MKKQWFFDRYCGQQFVALLEDGRLTEFAAEKEGGGEIVGNIYKGRVMNVLSGMQAAFVYCGLEKNCYLSTEDTYADYSKYDGQMPAPAPVKLKEGDEILVQVVKPPRGNKGAKVTTNLSFVGKNLIFLPNSEFLGISRKITDETVRERMLLEADKLRAKGQGFIVRTCAPTASKRDLKRECNYLKKLWQATMSAADGAPVGTALFCDLALPTRVMRDSIGDDVECMHVGDKELFDDLTALAKIRGDGSEKKIRFHKGPRALMREYGISELVDEACKPVVKLDCGGYLVIEHTEAMTVVDVNTGSFVGSSSLEETVFEVNMRAAEEVARQVRLRNVGGIVVVDFIDMVEQAHRDQVNAKLKECLDKDKARCNVLPMSELCLTQFTRKRVGADVTSYLVKPCETCKGRGVVPSDTMLFVRLRGDLLDLFADGYRSIIVDLNDKLMQKLLSGGVFSREVKERWKNNRIYLVPHRGYAENEYHLRGDNSGVLTLPDKAQILY